MTYGFLLESVWHPPLLWEDEVGNRLPGELELQALWFSGAFGRDFVTQDRKSARIVQFGEWNRGVGPDFRQVVVEIDGVTRKGALEIDMSASDWEHHGHATNPAFLDVVLHVSFRMPSTRTWLRTADHREVPQVIVTGTALEDGLSRPLRDSAVAHPGRCMSPLRGMPEAAVERLLRESALHRASRKFRIWSRMAEAHGPDATLYQAVAETLGYRQNRLAMRLLAQRAPLAVLKREPNDVEAVLFGVAGFLSPDMQEMASDPARGYLRSLWDQWWKSRYRFEPEVQRDLPWCFHGQRPANHPHRRIGALAALIPEWPTFRRLALADPFSAKPLMDFLQSLEHPFWTRHFTLTSQTTPARISIFGRNHALELIANHLVPIALHEGRIDWKGYWKLRHSVVNEHVKRCSIRLFGSIGNAQPWLKRLAHHQALLQIDQDFCLVDCSDCEACPFPEQLAQWR